jgi:ferritin-like metal-binding protein YciE
VRINTLRDLYIDQLENIYDAELQLIKELPQAAHAATNPKLKEAFTGHFQLTRGHVQRLQKVFTYMNMTPALKPCKAMHGLIEEASEMIKHDSASEVKDAGLIAVVQCMEHYEIAVYGTVRTFARILGQYQAATLLQETLSEENEADQLLTLIAINTVNSKAANANIPAGTV